MSNQFLCPRCRGLLNLGGHLVLSVKGKSPRRGLVFLNTELGNYKVIKHPHFELNQGELTEIYCPICHRKLRCARNASFARILMIDDNYDEFEILFSRIVGEECTYKIKEGEVDRFGQHSEKYNPIFKSLGSGHAFEKL
jgi:hypothetical protein